MIAVKGVVAAAARERVVAAAAPNDVVPGIAGQRVALLRTADVFDLGQAVGAAEAVGRRARRQIHRHPGGGVEIGRLVGVDAEGAAVERVVAGAADQDVFVGATQERVVAGVAEEDIGAGAAVQRVVAVGAGVEPAVGGDGVVGGERPGHRLAVVRVCDLGQGGASVMADNGGGMHRPGVVLVGKDQVAGAIVKRRDELEGRADDKFIQSVAGGDRIVAGRRQEDVVAGATGERVVAGAADHAFDVGKRIPTLAAADVLRAGGAEIDGDVAGGGAVIDEIKAAAAVDNIVAGAAGEGVVAGVADDEVVAGAAGDGIVADGAGEEGVRRRRRTVEGGGGEVGLELAILEEDDLIERRVQMIGDGDREFAAGRIVLDGEDQVVAAQQRASEVELGADL